MSALLAPGALPSPDPSEPPVLHAVAESEGRPESGLVRGVMFSIGLAAAFWAVVGVIIAVVV